eukprot:225506_1
MNSNKKSSNQKDILHWFKKANQGNPPLSEQDRFKKAEKQIRKIVNTPFKQSRKRHKNKTSPNRFTPPKPAVKRQKTEHNQHTVTYLAVANNTNTEHNPNDKKRNTEKNKTNKTNKTTGLTTNKTTNKTNTEINIEHNQHDKTTNKTNIDNNQSNKKK